MQSVRDHIISIPRIKAHDMGSELTDGAELHRDYSAESFFLAEKSAPNYDKFARIFNTEFNIDDKKGFM